MVQFVLVMFPYERPGWMHGSCSGVLLCTSESCCHSPKLCDFGMTTDVKTPENSGNGKMAIIHSGSLEGLNKCQESMQHNERLSGSSIYCDWFAKNVRGCTLFTWFYSWDGPHRIPYVFNSLSST